MAEDKNKITHPHDNFTKKVLGKPENAKSFVENYLPKEIVDGIDLNSLHIEKESYVTDKFKPYSSDILYSFDLDGKKAGIYVLIEHKSYYKKNTLRQMLKYMNEIWEKRDKYIVIIPVLIFHGNEKVNFKSNFEEMFELEDKIHLRFIPKFEIILRKLNEVHELLGTEELKYYIFLLKCKENPSMIKEIRTALVMSRITDNIIYFGLEYIITVTDESEHDNFIKNIKNTMVEDKMVSIAQSLERKGELRNKIEMAKKMLQKRCNLSFISEITGLSIERIKRLQ